LCCRRPRALSGEAGFWKDANFSTCGVQKAWQAATRSKLGLPGV
jgi:hypothetical protein